MKLLFVGDSWLGSNARSMREALSRQPGTLVEEIAADRYVPIAAAAVTQVFNRVLAPFQRKALKAQVWDTAAFLRPDAIVIYKGMGLDAPFVRRLRTLAPVVNIFPDYSPHAYGRALAEAMGVYDLVLSTKQYHPEGWKKIYGYDNRCACVTHGYDPLLDLRVDAPSEFAFDVALVATGRAEYGELLSGIAARLRPSVRVLVTGNYWGKFRARLPDHWVFAAGRHGVSYTESVRQAKIVLAPVQTRVAVEGRVQPGDVDTARTYQLAAAHCFFIHRRTPFVQGLYDESTEVPMFDDAGELADKIEHYLPRDEARRAMAAAAHARAVPAYSLDRRAAEVLRHIAAL